MRLSFPVSLLFIFLSLFLISCEALENIVPHRESAWIKPLDEQIDLETLRFSNSEMLTIVSNPEGLTPLVTMENESRGDERSAWQNKLYYTGIGFADFLGEATTTYYEIPFKNDFALSLKVGAMLWDASRKRSREFLPLGSPKAKLIFVVDPSSLGKKEGEREQEIQANLEFPMVWDNRKDAFNYEALLTPKELGNLLAYFEENPEGRLFLNIQERNYDATGLKEHIIADRTRIRQIIGARGAVALGNLQGLSSTVAGRLKFSSPWMNLGNFFAKVQTFYTATSTSASRLEIILGSYNPTLLRTAFMGNTSLVFSTESQVFFLPFEKLSFFSTLQQKQSALLSFATTPSIQRDFFQNTTWKPEIKEFWQINLSSQAISAEDLATIQAILADPAYTVSLSLTEDLLFSNGAVVNLIQHILNLLYGLKVGEKGNE